MCSLSNNFLERNVTVEVIMFLFLPLSTHYHLFISWRHIEFCCLVTVGGVKSDCFYRRRLAAPLCNAIYFYNQYFIVNSVMRRWPSLPYHSAPLTCHTFLARRLFLFIRSSTKPRVLRLNLTIHSRTKSFCEFFPRQRSSKVQFSKQHYARSTNLTTYNRHCVFCSSS